MQHARIKRIQAGQVTFAAEKHGMRIITLVGLGVSDTVLCQMAREIIPVIYHHRVKPV
jgi:hypothetical protein